jgi:hypothetical protein
MEGEINLSKAFDELLYNEMAKEDEDDLMCMDDDDILDSIMETTSINEDLSDIFPSEEKYMEV